MFTYDMFSTVWDGHNKEYTYLALNVKMSQREKPYNTSGVWSADRLRTWVHFALILGCWLCSLLNTLLWLWFVVQQSLIYIYIHISSY
jgi:hypothetical protein